MKRQSRGVNRAFCNGGELPQKCQACCQHKDTGCYCNEQCMKSIDVCKIECPIRNNIGRAYCTDLKKGWKNIPGRASIPQKCLDCCPGCGNVDDTDPPTDDDCHNFAACSASCTASASASCEATAIAKCTAQCNLSKKKSFSSISSSTSHAEAEAIAIAIADVEADSISHCGCHQCCCGILHCTASCVAKAMASCQANAYSNCEASCTATVCS